MQGTFSIFARLILRDRGTIALNPFILMLAVLFSFAGSAPGAVNHAVYLEVAQCLKCHPRALPTHPLYVAAKTPEGWPAGPGGQMVCRTCHDCSGANCVLRRPMPGLCKACHDCKQGMACVINSAHIGNSGDIEAKISDCAACHNRLKGRLQMRAEDHPVNVYYMDNTNSKLKKITDKRVVIVGGKVTCLSCHDPYNDESTRLVMSNKDSALCLVCHNM